jgi:hypothetical protein
MSYINYRNILRKIEKFPLPSDGRFTPELRWVLTNGHCHSFALALNRVTCWKLMGKITAYCDYSDGLDHLYCMKEPGVLVDANNLHRFNAEFFIDLHQWQRGCSGFLEVPLNYPFRSSVGWLAPQVDKLVPFAEERVRELETETIPTVHPIEYPTPKKQ